MGIHLRQGSQEFDERPHQMGSFNRAKRFSQGAVCDKDSGRGSEFDAK